MGSRHAKEAKRAETFEETKDGGWGWETDIAGWRASIDDPWNIKDNWAVSLRMVITDDSFTVKSVNIVYVRISYDVYIQGERSGVECYFWRM